MNLIEKDDRQDYYDVSRLFLSLIGQWLHQRPRERTVRISVNIIWLITVFAVQVAQFYVCETTQCILQTVPLHLIAWVALVKLLTCHFNNGRIKYLIEHLYMDWNILDTQEEREIMKRYAMNGRWYTFAYASLIYISASTFGASALLPRIMDVIFPLNESRPILLPCPAYYFVDEAKYFYYIFFHLALASWICITGFVAHDCILLTFVEHACGLFAIVGYRFENQLYKRNITSKSLINVSNDIYVENIAFSIQLHQRALQFATFIEETFFLSFTIIILITVIVMSTSLVQISEELNSDVTAVVKYFVYIVAQLFHLLALSYQGQKLINHNLETHAKIYNGLWYNIPVKSQKLLLFAMRKSTEIISLSAGKIYIFCLENFTLIIKSSVSYFMVMSSFSEP